MVIIYTLLGAVAGFLIGYFYLQLNAKNKADSMVLSHPLMIDMKQRNQELNQKLTEAVDKATEAQKHATKAETELKAAQDKLSTHHEELEKLEKKFQLQFENLANKIFDDKAEKFKKENSIQLDNLLNPFKEKLTDFEKKVEKVYGDENKERINLKAELQQLHNLNKQLSSDANNLATALKGNNKQQGNWGEMILDKILERSGLREGVEYEKQFTDENADGQRIRPDVVVNLPEGKHIIIDSKVSLAAYNQMVASEEDEERINHLRLHLDSIRNHIKQLSDKNYYTARKLITPDFVLLFMPIEAAFSTALQEDSELYAFAWDRRVVLVSPTTLLATLRTVASIWTQEKRTRNAEEIALEAGKLYDKFAGFVENLIAVGKKMDSAKEEYEEAMKKLSTGSGNLVNRAQNLKKLGARNTKEMNQKLIERAEESGTL